MPLDNRFQPGSINQVGQGLRGPGERRGWSGTLSAHFASSVAYGSAGTQFQRPPYFFNQLNPLFYGPSSELRSDVPRPLLEQQSFVQQIQGYRSPYWQGIAGLHPGNKGFGTSIVRNLTDFGSGFDKDKALNRAGAFFTNPLVTGLGATALLGVPSFHDPVRVSYLAAQSAALGYARRGLLGAGVGLGAFYALDKAGQAVNRWANQGDIGAPTSWDVMRHFMLYGLVEGGLAAGTSAAFLKGSPLRPLASEVVGFVGGVKGMASGTPFSRASKIPGLAPEFQEYASPLRRWFQPSIVETAKWLENPSILGMKPPIPSMSSDFAMKFSEAFHGEAAYTLRAVAESGGGIRNVESKKFYTALAKDIGIGSLGGLVESTLVGAAYLGITKLMGSSHRIAGGDFGQDQTIEGLHPGAYGTMGAGMIQGMTAFGSKINLNKAVNWHDYQGLSLQSRSRFMEQLGKVPGANIISFDVESTGLQTPLELVEGQRGRLTEFGIVTSKGGARTELHGFTQHASMSEYTKLYLEGGAFSKEFAKAGRRYAQYAGSAYKASDILDQIVSRIQPGQTNILAGHNITFDLKQLSAELALEKGYVSPALLSAFHTDPKHMRTINAGWQKAADHIRRAIKTKDANITIIDTLGGRYGKHPKVFAAEAARGMAADYTQGFTPGLANIWEQAGVEKESIPFALGTGKKLESLMGYFGIPFKGEAHGPISDAAATIDLLQGMASSTRIKETYAGIEAQNKRVAVNELEAFAKHQAAFQKQHLLYPQITEGARPLAHVMSTAFPDTSYARPAKTMEEAFHRLPAGTKWAAAGVGLALGYAAYRMVFAPTQKERNTQIEGLHPGAPRPAWMQGYGFGSGKIWEEIMGMTAAIRARGGELFVGESHGHALMKIKKAGVFFDPVRESYGFRMGDKSFISREEAERRYGIRTSEQLRVMQSTGKSMSQTDALQVLIDNNNKLPNIQEAYGELPGAMKPNHNSMGAQIIHSMTEFGGKYMGSTVIRGLADVFGLAGGFLSNETVGLIQKDMPKIRTEFTSRFAKLPADQQKLANEFLIDMNKAIDMANTNKLRGMPGIIAIDPQVLGERGSRGIIAHERQHFYNKLTGFMEDEATHYKVPKSFEEELLTEPHYQNQVKNHGRKTIADEYLAYSRQSEVYKIKQDEDVEAYQQAVAKARTIRKQGKLMVKQMPTAGLMHVMGDNAIRHNQMSSRIGV